MSQVSVDPTTGNHIHVTEHKFLVTMVDDAVYFGVMVWLYDQTGVNRWFLAMPDRMRMYPEMMQALRYGAMFASMQELRRFLNMWGLPTEASVWLDALMSHLK